MKAYKTDKDVKNNMIVLHGGWAYENAKSLGDDDKPRQDEVGFSGNIGEVPEGLRDENIDIPDDKPTIERIRKMMTLDGKLDEDTSEKIVRTLNKHSEALADAGLINLDNQE